MPDTPGRQNKDTERDGSRLARQQARLPADQALAQGTRSDPQKLKKAQLKGLLRQIHRTDEQIQQVEQP